MIRTILFSFALLSFLSTAHAHGPTPQKVRETVEISAPIERVWSLVSDFGKIAAWQPALQSSEGNSRPGSQRALTWANGQQLIEELDTYSAENFEYTYRLKQPNVDALPVSSYSAELKLTTDGTTTTVEWKSRLYRGDTGNSPPDHLSDEAAVAKMQDFFRAGLLRLKALAEGKP